MLGADAPHTTVPYFFSDLSDWAAIEYVGPALVWDEEVVRGSMDDGSFAVWYLDGGRVRGMLSVNGGGDVGRASELIAEGEAVGAGGVPG
jgi:3-phenylpropionate/trans-cinnamate dioxygenase ferredoxin reductase subunit